jgi:hypothetical protein
VTSCTELTVIHNLVHSLWVCLDQTLSGSSPTVSGISVECGNSDASRSLSIRNHPHARPEDEDTQAAVEACSAGNDPVDPFQVFQVREVDGHATSLGRHLHTHARVEVLGQQVLEFQ